MLNLHTKISSNPVGIYLLKINNRNVQTRREICLKLLKNTQKGRKWRRSDAFIDDFEQISNLILVSLLVTLNG